MIGQETSNEFRVGTLAHGRIEIDNGYRADPSKLSGERGRVTCLNGKAFTVHQLDGLSALKVDGWNNHSLTSMP